MVKARALLASALRGGGEAMDAARWAIVIFLFTVPTVTLGFYLALRTIDLPQASGPDVAQHDASLGQLEAMVAGLAARLEREPGDAQGWAVLARSYSHMQRYADAAQAFARLVELAPDDADALADYADVLAMTSGSGVAGEPLALVRRALAANPHQWKALGLAGTEAFHRKDYHAAIGFWERAQRVAPADSEFAQSIAVSLAEARALVGAQSAAIPSSR